MSTNVPIKNTVHYGVVSRCGAFNFSVVRKNNGLILMFVGATYTTGQSSSPRYTFEVNKKVRSLSIHVGMSMIFSFGHLVLLTVATAVIDILWYKWPLQDIAQTALNYYRRSARLET
jgi:hypothetical protein